MCEQPPPLSIKRLLHVLPLPPPPPPLLAVLHPLTVVATAPHSPLRLHCYRYYCISFTTPKPLQPQRLAVRVMATHMSLWQL